MFVTIVQEFLGQAPEMCIQNEYIFAGILFLIVFLALFIFFFAFLFSIFRLFK